MTVHDTSVLGSVLVHAIVDIIMDVYKIIISNWLESLFLRY